MSANQQLQHIYTMYHNKRTLNQHCGYLLVENIITIILEGNNEEVADFYLVISMISIIGMCVFKLVILNLATFGKFAKLPN